jgi:hypothetical protein
MPNAGRRIRSGSFTSDVDDVDSTYDQWWLWNYEELPHCVCMDAWTGYDCSLYRGEEITFSYKRHAGRSLGGYPEYVKFNRPEEMDKPIDPALAAIGEELNDWLLDWATENEAEAMVFFEETGVHLLNAAKEEREIPEASARIAEDSQLDVSFRYSGCPSFCKTCVDDFEDSFAV